MTLSLKNIAKNCLGKSAPLLMRWDVFGFHSNPDFELSLRRQLELLLGPGLSLNLILVANEDFLWSDIEHIQYAIQLVRNIYDDVGICVRKLRWIGISAANAGGYATIDSGTEAHDLTDDFSGPNGGYLDVFIVRTWIGSVGGQSNVNSPCSKDDKAYMTGVVVAIDGTLGHSGVGLAHEIGHYLGLSGTPHHPDPNNFMYYGTTGRNTDITSEQGDTMKNHCYIKDVC